MSDRKLQFTGVLFDGKTADKHPVEILLTPRDLVLRRQGDPASGSWSWPLTGLKWNTSSGTRTPPVLLDREVEGAAGPRTETLVVDDPDFLPSLKRVAPDGLAAPWPRGKGKQVWIVAASLLAMPFFIYFLWKLALPFFADRVAREIPVSWEEKLGEAVLTEFFPQGVSEPDPEIQETLDAILERLLASIPEQPYRFQVYVLAVPEVNAFALPGGALVVFQGLLNQTESPEELAGVLAHEIQHVLLRHSTRSILRSMASSLLLAAMLGDTGAPLEVAAELAEQLEGLRHSRDMEAQADRRGLTLLFDADIDPAGMIQIYEKFARLEKPPAAVPPREETDADSSPETEEPLSGWLDYLSTHPDPRARVAALKNRVAKTSRNTYTPLLADLDWAETVHRDLEPSSAPETPESETAEAKN